jgi:AraC family transcriptional regulator
VRGELAPLLPVLVRVQTQLDGDLSLAEMARIAGLSEFHFHRRFRDQVGETLKQYTQRLRLERAAYLLTLQRCNILQIALDCGFGSHETFSRAFKRHFGSTPSAYRRAGGSATQGGGNGGTALPHAEGHFELGSTRVRDLEPLHLAFIRHLGDYQEVPDSLYEHLRTWSTSRGLPNPQVYFGIGHDAPGLTSTEQLRYDAAIPVPGPFAPDGDVGYQRLQGGPHAITSHVGHFSTLFAAYREIFARTAAMRRYRLVGLPAIEIYRTTCVNAAFDLNHTEVCLPVEKA